MAVRSSINDGAAVTAHDRAPAKFVGLALVAAISFIAGLIDAIIEDFVSVMSGNTTSVAFMQGDDRVWKHGKSPARRLMAIAPVKRPQR